MAKKKRSPILELSSDIDRDFILIDGQECQIKNKQELSIVDYHWLKRSGQKSGELFGKDDLSQDELDELSKTINDLIDFIFVDTPKDTINKLTEGQKFEIMMAFTNLLSGNPPKGETAGTQAEASSQ